MVCVKSTMSLNRIGGRGESVGDDRLARPEPVQHAAGQHVEQQLLGALLLGAQFARRGLVPVAEELALERGRHAGAQQDRVDGLGEVVVGAGLDAMDRALDLAEGRHDDDRQRGRGRRRLDAPQHLDAAQPRHQQVEQHEVVAGRLQQFQRALAVVAARDLVAVAAEAARQQVERRGVVVDEQHPTDGARPRRALVLEDRAERLHGFVQPGILVEELPGLLAPPFLVEAQEVHHGVDLVEQPPRRLQDVGERTRRAAGPAGARAVGELLAQEFAITQDGRDGRAQLVAQVARCRGGVPPLHQALRGGGIQQRAHGRVEPPRRRGELVDVVAGRRIRPVLDQEGDEARDGLDGRLELRAREDREQPAHGLAGVTGSVSSASVGFEQTRSSPARRTGPCGRPCIPPGL